ncbi:hypothetical protein SLEP1_g18619 [Rubroshorea leprosula]|uniref:Uncharacterized protein n=1 Tax=Rubroshorea leprosula TaxID=152421 RepID=A0AAV5J1L6_9ROSI|nr:hypothetical protein SLEP1_g18619 [Rubroshorea leprosula]
MKMMPILSECRRRRVQEAQQGAAPGVARRSLGCNRAQPQVQQGAGSSAARRRLRCSKRGGAAGLDRL